ncbi:MAG: adenylate kinase [Candidatus Brockarchaeota archaeon]|nr:adenylate kinase [Candidatus Brockarchaeota archaeon]MBO3809867.1 adenylate kinase [Candidatus Brockarchaeota archaeon]
MRLVIFGPPGSGKGTYASRLVPRLGVPHISTGDILRDEVKSGSELGKSISSYVSSGKLVPDEVVNRVMEKRLSQEDCRRGFILDGYPRTLQQAYFLEGVSKIDFVINLNVPDEVIVRRLSSRLVCRKCGAIYNKITLPPKVDGVCDKCGGELYQRDDDKPEVVRERIRVYKNEAAPLLEHYRKAGVTVIDFFYEPDEAGGDVSPDTVVDRIIKALKGSSCCF